MEGWWVLKTLWWIDPVEQGGVLIRARRLDGNGLILIGNGPPAGRHVVTINTEGGPSTYSEDSVLPDSAESSNFLDDWRNYPGATALRGPGCYGFQVDGKSFTETIVFEAVF